MSCCGRQNVRACREFPFVARRNAEQSSRGTRMYHGYLYSSHAVRNRLRLSLLSWCFKPSVAQQVSRGSLASSSEWRKCYCCILLYSSIDLSYRRNKPVSCVVHITVSFHAIVLVCSLFPDVLHPSRPVQTCPTSTSICATLPQSKYLCHFTGWLIDRS